MQKCTQKKAREDWMREGGKRNKVRRERERGSRRKIGILRETLSVSIAFSAKNSISNAKRDHHLMTSLSDPIELTRLFMRVDSPKRTMSYSMRFNFLSFSSCFFHSFAFFLSFDIFVRHHRRHLRHTKTSKTKGK